MTKPLLMVVEDDEGVRSALTESLERKGHDVIAVADGAEALRTIRDERRRPALIVLDLNMPVLSGWEFLSLRRGDPVLLLIPVIVVSAETEGPPEVPEEFFLRKPVNFSKLEVLIDKVLSWSSPEPERLPHRSEPWSQDAEDARVVRNSFGQAVAYAATDREARRMVAAINGTSRVSTEALEQGIIDKGLDCLYDLNRYDVDEEYRGHVGGDSGLERILERRREIAAQWKPAGAGVSGDDGVN